MAPANSLHRGQETGEYVSAKYHALVQPHVESFDAFIDTGLASVISSLPPARVRSSNQASAFATHRDSSARAHHSIHLLTAQLM